MQESVSSCVSCIIHCSALTGQTKKEHLFANRLLLKGYQHHTKTTKTGGCICCISTFSADKDFLSSSESVNSDTDCFKNNTVALLQIAEVINCCRVQGLSVRRPEECGRGRMESLWHELGITPAAPVRTARKTQSQKATSPHRRVWY